MSAVPYETLQALYNDLGEFNYTGSYGDGYLVGTETPYELYIWTRSETEGIEGSWFDWGPLNAPSIIPGPPGETGAPGPQGTRGSQWHSQSGAPTNMPGLLPFDQYIDGSTGNIYQWSGNAWQPTGKITGPVGPRGPRGEEGPQGIQGERGFKGDKGDTGQFIVILGDLPNTENLPMPDTVQRDAAYLIPDAAGTKHVWLLVGEGTAESPINWVDAGPVSLGSGTKITMDGIAQTELAADYVPKISINYQISDDTNVTSNGSEVTFSSLQTTGQNMTNEDISGLSVIELPIANGDYIELNTSDGATLKFELNDDFWDEIDARVDSAKPPEVQISAPTTSTSGTLTTTQLSILQSNKGAYLMFNNEVYRLQDTQHVSGYLVYSHVGYDNNTSVYMIKCITITISTRGWVLTTKQVQSQLTINGNTTTTSFYAPTSVGTSGYKLKSNGSGAPTWVQDLITTVNGSTTVGKTIYAPTSYGSTGYHLKANESGVAPSWENPLSTLRSISISAAGANSGTFTLTIPTEDWNSSSTVMIIEGYLLYNNNTRGYRSMTIPVSRFKQYNSDTYRFGFSAYGDYRAEAYISGTTVSGTNTIVTITIGNSDRCYFSNIYLQR